MSEEKKIAYLEHEGVTYYVFVEIVLKRFYRLTKNINLATPLTIEEQKKVASMDNRVKFLNAV